MNEFIVENYQSLESKVNVLSLRERVLVGITGLVFLYLIWRAIVYGVIFASETEMAQSTQQLQQTISNLQAQIIGITQSIGVDQTLVKTIQALNEQDKALQLEVQEQTKKMVSPKEMVIVIKSLLAETKGLTVVSLESTPTTTLFMEEEANNIVTIYNHGIQLELIGEYFEILYFLKLLEQKNMHMIWHEIIYDVQKYPKARVRILLQTLGLESGWIGV